MWKHSKLLLSNVAYILEVNFEYQYNKEDVYPLDSNISLIHLSSVHFSRSVVSNSLQPHELQHARPPCPSLPGSTQTHVHLVDDAIQPSHPLVSPSLPAFNFSSIRVFSSESVLCIRWPKYWSFSFNTSPSNEHPGLISFRMDWY